jgi:predicted nucleic acid-binding protein
MTRPDPVFVDTNVILYWLASHDSAKNKRAAEWMDLLWSSGAGRISWQVLHECYTNATQKLKVPTARARAVIELLSEWQMPEMGLEIVNRAWHWNDSAQTSYWDGLIVGAAEQCACRWLLSEDFQDGQKYGKVTIVNPFRHAPAELT